MITTTLTKEQKEIIEKVQKLVKEGVTSYGIPISDIATLITSSSEEEMWKVIERIAGDNTVKEITKQTFNDILICGECMIHIDENGKEKRIEPCSEEYYAVKENATKEALEKSTKYIPWNEEADKEAKGYLLQQSPNVDWEKSCIEKTKECMLQSLRIKELEEQIVTYCRENPAAEKWFQITVKRDNNENS